MQERISADAKSKNLVVQNSDEAEGNVPIHCSAAPREKI